MQKFANGPEFRITILESVPRTFASYFSLGVTNFQAIFLYEKNAIFELFFRMERQFSLGLFLWNSKARYILLQSILN
jgi:hypothetical protein